MRNPFAFLFSIDGETNESTDVDKLAENLVAGILRFRAEVNGRRRESEGLKSHDFGYAWKTS